jgi:hypothetical protein
MGIHQQPIKSKKFYRNKIKKVKMKIRALCSQVILHTFFQNFFEILKNQHKNHVDFLKIQNSFEKKIALFSLHMKGNYP